MNRMLEGYLAFARGDAGEETMPTDVDVLLRELGNECADHRPRDAGRRFSGDPIVKVRPQGFKRCLDEPRRERLPPRRARRRHRHPRSTAS